MRSVLKDTQPWPRVLPRLPRFKSHKRLYGDAIRNAKEADQLYLYSLGKYTDQQINEISNKAFCGDGPFVCVLKNKQVNRQKELKRKFNSPWKSDRCIDLD